MTDKLRSSLSTLSRIIFHNETDVFKNEFYHDEKLVGEGYSFVSESKPNMFFEAYIKFPENRNQDVDIINFDSYKSLKLNSLFIDIENEVKDHRQLSKPSFNNLLVEVYDELTGIFKKAVNDERDSQIVEHILILKNIFKFKYSHILDYHRFYDLHKPNQKLTQGLFQPKEELKKNFFKDLYLELVDYRLIDSEKTSQEDFINTLTLPTPQRKIQFTSNNYMIVFVLDHLKHFFHSFTTSSIGDSKLFLNRKGKTLLARDLNSARTRGKEKDLYIKKQFEEVFNDLKDRYPV